VLGGVIKTTSSRVTFMCGGRRDMCLLW